MRSSEDAEDRSRPRSLVLVYTWDIVRALLALLGAFTAFAGGIQIGNRTVTLPLYQQIALAIAAAAYAAALVLVGVVLGRRQRWVRQAQMLALVLVLLLIVASWLIGTIQIGSFDPGTALGAGIFAVIDVAALYAMTAPKVKRWYSEDPDKRIPRSMRVALGLWLITNVIMLVLQVFG